MVSTFYLSKYTKCYKSEFIGIAVIDKAAATLSNLSGGVNIE